MAGQRVRRLRRERGLTQAKMASQLGVSTSYLNLIERNQRPVTVQFLLKLGQTFDIDLKRFAEDEEGRVVAQLKEVFSDPLFAKDRFADADIRDVAAASPALGDAVFRLFRGYRDLVDNAATLADGGGEPTDQRPQAVRFPGDDVQEFLQAESNFFPEIEEAADQLWSAGGLTSDRLLSGLCDVLSSDHGIKVRFMPFEVMQDTLRRFDRHGRRVLLSEILPAEDRLFQLAHQIGLLGWRDLFESIAERTGLPGDARRLIVIALADYFAGAVLMPYARFFDAAETLRYDVELLARRFGASDDQVCDRLTTLQRPGAKGVPFFLARIDAAGNVLRRFSAGGFHFARFGGLCPLWRAHDALPATNQPHVERVSLPDGARFVTIARAVQQPGAGQSLPAHALVVIMGSPVSYAPRLCYADMLGPDDPDAATPIGVNCRLCDRLDCGHRAFPPLNRRLIVDETLRSLAPYFFA